MKMSNVCLYFMSVLFLSFENSYGKDYISFNSSQFLGSSNFYLNALCPNIPSNIGTECAVQMDIVCNNNTLLIQMSDAWSKFPYTGMLVSTRTDWGTFDQCIAVDHQSENGMRVLGKHCANGLVIPLELNFEDLYFLSYCVPDKCNATDLVRMIGILPEPLVNDVFCTTKEDNKELDAGALTVLTVFVVILVIMVISTIYEIILHQRKTKNRNPILTAFSIFTNSKKMVQTTSSHSVKDQILAFHGLKVISMMWIVAGHAAGGFSVLPVVNREDMANFENQRYSQYLMTAHLAVDTFFYISGFLLAYQYFKGSADRPIGTQIMSIPGMILHRYLRITPAVLMYFLYTVYLAKYIGSGPLFNVVNEGITRSCREHWWAVFLYIQNYYNPNDLCWTHLWYLSADWQLFLLSPLIIIPVAIQFRKYFNWVLVQLLLLNLVFMFLPLFTKLMFPLADPEYQEFDAHSRLIDYFMGFTFGFYLRHERHKPYIFKSIFNVFFWICTLLLMTGTIFVLQEININHDYVAKALTYTFMRPIWCLGLSFIIYSCVHGKGGVINWILSSGAMQIGSKLTYCMYLTHVAVILYWVATMKTKSYFSDFNLFYAFCGHFILTVVAAVLWSLAFESPLITIERVIFGGRRSEKPKKGKVQETYKPKLENEVV